MIQRVEPRVRVLPPWLRASAHVRRHIPWSRQMGALSFQRPLTNDVFASPPPSSCFKRFKTRPSLFRQLSGQRFHGMAALHSVSMCAQTGLLPQHMLDVPGPAQCPRVLFVSDAKSFLGSDVVGTDFQPVHTAHHGRVSRNGVGQQRVPTAVRMEPQRGRLGFKAKRPSLRTSHVAQQAMPHGTGGAGQCDAGQHVGVHRHPHCRVSGGIL